jgi:hypothetical protein
MVLCETVSEVLDPEISLQWCSAAPSAPAGLPAAPFQQLFHPVHLRRLAPRTGFTARPRSGEQAAMAKLCAWASYAGSRAEAQAMRRCQVR